MQLGRNWRKANKRPSMPREVDLFFYSRISPTTPHDEDGIDINSEILWIQMGSPKGKKERKKPLPSHGIGITPRLETKHPMTISIPDKEAVQIWAAPQKKVQI